VVDTAGYDTGKLLSWGLVITEATTSPETIRAENTTPQAIPDAQQTGVSSVITVDSGAVVGELVVHVKVTHTYIGDLVVVLKHGGTEQPLMNREGGSGDNIDRDFIPAAWAGQSAAGDWTLVVSDQAASDTGTLDSWSLSIVPAP